MIIIIIIIIISVSHYHYYYISSLVSLWNDLDYIAFDNEDWLVYRAEPMPPCWPDRLILYVSYYFLFFFIPWIGCAGLGSLD